MVGLLGGRYELLALVGRGTQGNVYRAVDHWDSVGVALKVLNEDAAPNSLRLWAALSHPNIVKVLDVDLSSERRFVAMEYVEGPTLREAYLDGGEDALFPLVHSICNALHAAHSRGVCHGDLKPTNILVERCAGDEFRAKLSDFGLGRAVGDPADGFAGTLAYAPPELLRGESPDHRSDLYSLGATLYEVVTGRQVFPSDDLRDLAEAHLSVEPGDPRLLSPSLSDEMANLVLSLLAKEPSKRPRSAAEVSELAGDGSGPVRLGDPAWVGRQRELRFMARIEQLAAEGRGTVVIVAGEHGAGKSALLRELQLDWGVRGRRSLRLGCGDAIPSLRATDELMHRARSLASHKKTVSREDRAVPQDAGTLAREFVVTVRKITRDKPLLVVLDDVGRADESFLCLLHALAPLVAPERLVTVATADGEGLRRLRENVPALLELPHVRRINLRPLSRDDTETLVASALCHDTHEPELVSVVHHASSGNPGIASEVLRHLVLRGYVARRSGVWEVNQVPGQQVLDDELAYIAESRVKLLDEDQRRVLGAIALVGPAPPAELLNQVLGRTGEHLGVVLRALEERDLVVRQGDRWTLKHGLLSGAAKAALNAQEKTTLHARAAAAMLGRSTKSIVWSLPLARHLAGSGQKRKAFAVAVKAADICQSKCQYGRALDLYELAETCIGVRAGRRRLRILKGQANCYMLLGRWRQASERLSRLFDLPAARTLDINSSCALRLWAARAFSAQGDEEKATEQLNVALSSTGLEQALRAKALATAAHVAADARRWTEAEAHARSSLELLGETPDDQIRCEAENTLGVALTMRGKLKEARERLEASYELRRAGNQALDAGKCATNLGILYRRLGRYETARRYLGDALDRFESSGAAVWQAQARNVMGLLELNSGFPTAAAAALELAVRLATDCGRWQSAGLALNNLGLARKSEGKWEEALAKFRQALGLGRRKGYGYLIQAASSNLGDVYLAAGDLEVAEGWFKDARDAAAREGDPLGIGVCTLGLAKLRREQGRLPDADRAIAKALKVLADAGDERSLAYGWCELAELKLAQEQAEAALEAGETALGHLPEGSIVDEAMVLRILGKARAAARRPEEASRAFRRCLELLEGTESVEELALARLEVGRWLAERGQSSGFRAAERYLTQARDGFRKLGARRRAEEAEVLLGKLTRAPSEGLAVHSADGRKLLSLYRMMTLVNSATTSEGVLEQVLDLAVHAVHGERGLIILLDKDTGKLEVRARADVDQTTITDARRMSESVVRHVAGAGTPVFSPDALHDARFSEQDSIKLHRIACFMCVPLALRGEVRGTIYVDSCNLAHRFSEEDVEYLTAFAHHAAIAMEGLRIREELRKENEYLQAQLRGTYSFDSLVGRSPQMEAVYGAMAMVARSPVTVVIQGETGTGKELIARAIHYESDRSDGRFVPVNCGAMPEQLLESELFGYVKGAFTGAVKNTDGLFQLAHGGTVFLDEIADMSPDLQAKLLRVLETGELKQLGRAAARRVDVRIICASNRDLEREMIERRFREDLYYRLKGITINVPPLRDRRQDIPLLASHFLKEYAGRLGKEVGRFSEDAISWMCDREWPGNVRELEHTVEVAVALCGGAVITLDTILLALGTPPSVAPPERQAARPTLAQARSSLERRYIGEILRETRWNVSETARRLDVDRRQLQRLMKRHGLNP